MNPNEYAKYLKTTIKEDVNELIKLLDQNNISYELENYPKNFNSSYNVDINNLEFLLKIRTEDFDKVEKIELKHYSPLIKNARPDYYLYEFSENELKEIIQKSDEWSKFDFILAKDILAKKGIFFDEKKIQDQKDIRLEKLAKTEKSQIIWIVVGYIFALSGGLLGLIIGWHLTTHKKTLPNGTQVFDYNEKDRKHGTIIFVLGIIILVFSAIRFIDKL